MPLWHSPHSRDPQFPTHAAVRVTSLALYSDILTEAADEVSGHGVDRGRHTATMGVTVDEFLRCVRPDWIVRKSQRQYKLHEQLTPAARDRSTGTAIHAILRDLVSYFSKWTDAFCKISQGSNVVLDLYLKKDGSMTVFISHLIYSP